MFPTVKRLDVDPRYIQQNASAAVRDIFDALTELITNADDAYQRAHKAGRIEVDVERKRKDCTVLRVRDFAKGMSAHEMEVKLSRLGSRRNSGLSEGEIVRGTNSRGAKDVAALGPVTFASISDNNRFARCQIVNGEFWMWPEMVAESEARATTGIAQGVGTVVTIEIGTVHRVPQHMNLKTKLEALVFLREILADPSRELVLRDVRQAREDILKYVPPQGKERVKETFEIPGYPEAKAKLTILRSAKPLENRQKFRRGGILVKSRKAVHESTLFDPALEHDPHAALFFGTLKCEYIDDLWNAFDERSEDNLEPDARNPCAILDPLRQAGLRRDHPFFQALQREVLKRLRPLVEEERRQEQAQRAKIENQETRRRLNDLEKLATQFMKDQQEDDEDDLDHRLEHDLPKGRAEFLLSPPFAKIVMGRPVRFVLTIDQEKRPDIAEGSIVQIECATNDVAATRVSCPMEPHPTIDGLLRATWEVVGNTPTKATGVTARTGSVVATSVIEVLEHEKDLYSGITRLQFHRERYRVRPGQRKTIRLLAPFPAVVDKPTPITIQCDHAAVRIVGGRVLMPREHLGIAECKLTVMCEMPDLITSLKASTDKAQAVTEVCCAPPQGDAIQIKLDDVGETWNQRFQWQKGTNTLIIGARHCSLRRYLGAANAGFPGQDKAQFQVLLAEIVAFAVSEKVLERRVASNPDAYRDADLVAYLAERDELATKFLPLAHEAQVPKPL